MTTIISGADIREITLIDKIKFKVSNFFFNIKKRRYMSKLKKSNPEMWMSLMHQEEMH